MNLPYPGHIACGEWREVGLEFGVSGGIMLPHRTRSSASQKKASQSSTARSGRRGMHKPQPLVSHDGQTMLKLSHYQLSDHAARKRKLWSVSSTCSEKL
eukprot:CAMPEP_0184500262 /NCGR_PEP_ID=MMETSP0113_2-20130426/44148_1 /TAXON_ID=91329 /ORGANISM="Norrisiella sphaerica, Strain BC52" /LENGTH=98 /DNA_ID=CAMNT_0026888551 /DNA_START=72 /DNA_END=365 /DNA_ORIENTATION=+